jgi:SufS family cysteine desulfurase
MTAASRREFVTALGAAMLPVSHSSFPALRQKVNGQPLVYLDSAATTLRPRDVIDAVAGYYATDNANPSKVHSLAARAAERLHAARQTVARFVNASHVSEVIFVRGTTEGVNLVASSWGGANLGSGDEIVLSIAEHSSNFMPWARAAERAGAKVRLADVDEEGRLSADSVAAVLSSRTKLVAFSHVSNVLGYVNAAREITAAARAAGALVAIDGAQAAPHVRIDVRDIGCDFYIFSGHKMLGPMATGVVWGRQELLDRMPPYHVGSNMAHEVTFEHATFERGALKFQAGTPDVAGPVGLAAAIAFLERMGHDMLQKHDDSLARHGLERLRGISGVRLIGPTGGDRRLPVFSFTVAGLAPAAVASELDRRGIAVRAGDLAALPLLKRFGVAEAVRASAYVYSATRDFDRLADALAQIAGA